MARTDAIVLGAGIVGTSIALHLAKRGLSVALLDRGKIISPAYSRLNKREVARLRAVSTPRRAPLLPESGD